MTALSFHWNKHTLEMDTKVILGLKTCLWKPETYRHKVLRPPQMFRFLNKKQKKLRAGICGVFVLTQVGIALNLKPWKQNFSFSLF